MSSTHGAARLGALPIAHPVSCGMFGVVIGVGDGVRVGEGRAGLMVAVGTELGVGVGVADGLSVGLPVGEGICVAVTVAVAVTTRSLVGVGVTVDVAAVVGVSVSEIGVGETVGV